MSERDLVARIGAGVSCFAAEDWDRCAGGDNPFLSHAFLSALEDSGSVGPLTGWQSLPIAIDDADGRPAAVMPAYAKSHSQGEYVFDHAWANAFERAGGHYYPKLQIAVPFTPVPGPRLLSTNPQLDRGLIAAAEAVVRNNGLSSAHATFVEEDQIPLFDEAGWLIRIDRQFHWHNRSYSSFDDFLAGLSSRKRKMIRRERTEALRDLRVTRVSGEALTEGHWDAFWTFYQDTGARKWGRPYLTRRFFSLLGERMSDRLLLIVAEREGMPIAGALNLIGSEALFGRYWGAVEEVPFLHFELSYYQAIKAAIELGLQRVEAGAQGEHKLARGYEPVPTYSAHYLADASFRDAVADYLERERAAVEDEMDYLRAFRPFRKN